MRRICYISGSRADFGLISYALKQAQLDSRLEVLVCVTGMHLSPLFGNTIRDIESSGLRICGKVPVVLDGSTGGVMARAIGHELIGIVDVLEAKRPDLVMVLGDRGEMLAGALAAIHLNIPLVHVHGGELSGTIDEPIRHAISKLAHYHFVATDGSRERLIRMGEKPQHIYVTGAPGLDSMRGAVRQSRAVLCEKYGFDIARPVAIVVFHPVLQEENAAGEQARQLMQAIATSNIQALCLTPNSDAGATQIQTILSEYAGSQGVRLVEHIPREEYIDWMAAADLMVGNSSSGIIEAASFGLPVVNIGNRQHGRERSGNVVDVDPIRECIDREIARALEGGKRAVRNVYGDGLASERMVGLLATLPLDRSILVKTNAY